jgi:hypothetical protein
MVNGEVAVLHTCPAGLADGRVLAAAVRDFATRFDPALVTTRDAMELVAVLAQVEHTVAASKALAAARVADAPRLLNTKGFRSAAEFLASTAGTKIGDAIGMLETVEALDGLDAATEAFKTGKLSPRQAKVVAGAAKANPSSEDDLLRLAANSSLRDLETKAREVRQASSVETDEDRHARLHRERSVRTWIDAESGAGCGQWRLPPAEHAAVLAALEPATEKMFQAARRDDREEPREAYAADALLALVNNAGGATGAASFGDLDRVTTKGMKIIVRVDATAARRGHALDDEMCEIAGLGRIPASIVQRWLATGDPFVAAIVTDGVDITSITHLGRKPIALQQTALDWLHGNECSVEGCHATVALEVDHTEPWAATATPRSTSSPDSVAATTTSRRTAVGRSDPFTPTGSEISSLLRTPVEAGPIRPADVAGSPWPARGPDRRRPGRPARR